MFFITLITELKTINKYEVNNTINVHLINRRHPPSKWVNSHSNKNKNTIVKHYTNVKYDILFMQ